MEEVTVRRELSAPPEAVRNAIQDLKPFMKAAGFDQVDVDDDFLHVANQVGIATIELKLEVVDHPDGALAYEQREGIFEEMRTIYEVDSTPAGTKISATTRFALDIAIVGEVLDSTVIKHQRRKELTAQLDWLDESRSE